MTVPANSGGQEPPAGNPPQGQAPAGEQGQQGAPGQAPTTPPGEQGGPIDLSTITDPNLRAYIEGQIQDAAKARQEAARYRTERNALQTQAEQQRQASLTEEQRAQEARQREAQELETLRREVRDMKVGQKVADAAKAANAFDGSTVWALIKDSVTTDDQGNPTNVDALIAGLKQSHAYLFRRSTADAGAGVGSGGSVGQSMNDAIRAAAGRTPGT